MQGGEIGGSSGIGWVVDPIDGTVNLTYDLPVMSVSIAATVDGETGEATLYIDGKAVLRVADSGGRTAQVVSSKVIADGQWHHLVVEADRVADLLRIHVDGKADADDADAGVGAIPLGAVDDAPGHGKAVAWLQGQRPAMQGHAKPASQYAIDLVRVMGMRGNLLPGG